MLPLQVWRHTSAEGSSVGRGVLPTQGGGRPAWGILPTEPVVHVGLAQNSARPSGRATEVLHTSAGPAQSTAGALGLRGCPRPVQSPALTPTHTPPANSIELGVAGTAPLRALGPLQGSPLRTSGWFLPVLTHRLPSHSPSSISCSVSLPRVSPGCGAQAALSRSSRSHSRGMGSLGRRHGESLLSPSHAGHKPPVSQLPRSPAGLQPALFLLRGGQPRPP